MAGYWPSSFFASLWTETKSRSTNSQKKERGQYVWVIGQARGQNGWILAKSFFCVFMDRDAVEVHKLAKKEQGQYPAIFTEQAWSIKDLLYGIRHKKVCFALAGH